MLFLVLSQFVLPMCFYGVDEVAGGAIWLAWIGLAVGEALQCSYI